MTAGPGQDHNTVILRVVFTHSFTLIISIAQGCRFVNTIGKLFQI